MLNFFKNAFNSNNSHSIEEYESKIIKSLHILTIMTLVLAVSRLFSLEIMTMIGELMTAFMIYFYSQSRNKCMAIFCMINGSIGLIYGILRIISTFPAMKANWFSIYSTILFLISLYALVVYSLICYYAYIGIVDSNQNNSGFLPSSTNYGAIISDNKPPKSFIPFEGTGTVIG
jgi:hypothetical protein